MTPLCKTYFTEDLEDEYGADVQNLSGWWYDTGSNNWSNTEMVFNTGYSTFVDATVASVSGGINITYNAVVTSIDYSQSIAVVTALVNGVSTTYRAPKVIVTVPLGVLQSNSISFNPTIQSVSSAKKTAINQTGMGLLNHIYLQFPDGTLQAAGLHTVDVLYKVPNNYSTQTFPAPGRGITEISLWKRIRGLDVVGGEASGSYAAYLETLTDTAIQQVLLAELRAIWTQKGLTLPTPIGYKISRWNSDPYAKGSYSYMKVGVGCSNSANNCNSFVTALQSTLISGSRVYFAGEHTDIDYPATVPGAYASGVREATKIISGQ